MFELNKYYHGCDWIQGVLPIDDAQIFFDNLELIDSSLSFKYFKHRVNGLLGYSTRYCLNDKDYFVVCWNATTDIFKCSTTPVSNCTEVNKILPGVFLYVSGDGLRLLSSLNCQEKFFKLLRSLNFKCNRFDLCIDFYNPDNLIVPLLQGAFEISRFNLHDRDDNGEFIRTGLKKGTPIIHSRLSYIRKFEHVDNLRYKGKGEIVCNYRIGGGKSRLGEVKLYDKWLEVNTVKRLKDSKEELLKDVPEKYWFRLEYTLKTEYSQQIFNQFVDEDCNISLVAKYCLNKLFRVVLWRSEGFKDCQCNLSETWTEFLNYFNNISDGSLKVNLAKLPFQSLPVAIRYYKKMCATFYGFLKASQYRPDILRTVLRDGRVAFETKTRYRQLNLEIENYCNSSVLPDFDELLLKLDSFDYEPSDQIKFDLPKNNSLPFSV